MPEPAPGAATTPAAAGRGPRVSMVIPMYNAEGTIREAISSLLEQEQGVPEEIIVVDDASTDASAEIVEGLAISDPRVRLIRQDHRGAPRTVNHGVQEAQGELIGLLDSDAMVHPRWLATLLPVFVDPKVYAAAGRIEIANPQSLPARIAGSELLHRYSRLRGPYVDHLSTCSILYRREVFTEVGLFDPSYAIGYDVDMSYRIRRLDKLICYRPEAICYNFWREKFYAYYRQQFRYAYDRAELIRTHEGRMLGDDVSGPRMFMQVPMTAALLLSTALLGYQVAAIQGILWGFLSLALLALILAERLHEALTTFRVTKDPIVLFLPPVHLVRNVAWVLGVAYWAAKRLRSPRRGRLAGS